MKGTGTEPIALGKSKPTLSGAEFLSRWKEIAHEVKKYTEGISFTVGKNLPKDFQENNLVKPPSSNCNPVTQIQLEIWLLATLLSKNLKSSKISSIWRLDTLTKALSWQL